MKSLLYRNVTSKPDRIVVTIGNFDGMHLGHKSIFQELIRMGKEEDAVPTLVSFYPHPKHFFYNKKKVPTEGVDRSLTSPRQKLARANSVGIKRLVLIHFNDALSKLSALDFFDKKILPLGDLRGVVVGKDWRFGRDKSGSVDTLIELGAKYGIRVEILEDQLVDGERISSSLVRKAILNGDVKHAARYLGYNYSLSGHVKRGDQRGRLLGFPTMNLTFKDELIPAYGVYKTNTTIGNTVFSSITNVGIRPTFNGSKPVVETNVFGFSGENYGERIEVEFLERIRPEVKFANIDELKSQIGKDIAVARNRPLGK